MRDREDWRDFVRLGRLLEQAEWRFAKTMPENPHEYSLAAKGWRRKDFEWAVQAIRRLGYRSWFRGRPYVQVDVNDHFYWTMGAPLPKTILINRKRLERSTPYDYVADFYHELFYKPEYREEDDRLLRHLERAGMLQDKVLEIGAGGSILAGYVDPDRYIGLEPSTAFYKATAERYPEHRFVNTTLYDFCPLPSDGDDFSVVALYGTGSYLDPTELARIPLLARERAFIMFYRGVYEPVTHAFMEEKPVHYKDRHVPLLVRFLRKEGFDVKVGDMGNYVTVEARK